MDKLTPEAKELISRPILAWATTVRPDGTLHGTIVWADVDGDDLIVNTATHRAKVKHLRTDPRISINMLDPDDIYHFVNVSGTAELYTEGANDVIDRLAKKYLGADSYPFHKPTEQRINVRITPERIVYSGGPPARDGALGGTRARDGALAGVREPSAAAVGLPLRTFTVFGGMMDTEVQLMTSGEVAGSDVERAEQAVRAVLADAGEPGSSARITLTVLTDPAPPRPALAQVVVDLVDGSRSRRVRAQAAAQSLPEAIDLLRDRLAIRAA